MYAITIVNTYSGISRYEAERLRTEFANLGVRLDVVENSVGAVIPEADFVVFLDKDIRLATELEARGYRLFNSAEAIRICDDKALTYTLLRASGVAYPDTVFAPLCYSDLSEMQSKVAEEANSVTRTLGLPLVLKFNTGSLGMGTMLIENEESLRAKMTEYARVPHHYQRYIAAARGRDTRVIVIGGRAVAAMRRVNARDFRSNVATGGQAEEYLPSAECVAVAERSARALGLDYCGVDILEGEEGPLLLEVNSNAFYKGIESVSGVNVAALYAEHILRELGK